MGLWFRRTLLFLALTAPLGWIFSSGFAKAATSYDSPYTFEQTYGTSLRLLRVDMGFKITEKDPENGFLVFEYTSPESSKTSNGSVELVRGKEGVHVAVQLPAMPSYHERMLLDALIKKLATEHGEPPKRPKPAPAPDDAGADGADGGAN